MIVPNDHGRNGTIIIGTIIIVPITAHLEYNGNNVRSHNKICNIASNKWPATKVNVSKWNENNEIFKANTTTTTIDV